MIAFVSPVSEKFLNNPLEYKDIQGQPYFSIQTNESAIVYVERMLKKNSLSKIFLIASDSVKKNSVPAESEFGKITHLEFLQRRLLKEFPNLEGKFIELDYSDSVEDKNKFETNILQIADIADAITNYSKNYPDEEIIMLI